MIVIVIRNVYLRPTMSPIRPKITAPNGRTAKPAAKASSVMMNCAVVDSGAKNCLPTTAASVPNM